MDTVCLPMHASTIPAEASHRPAVHDGVPARGRHGAAAGEGA